MKYTIAQLKQRQSLPLEAKLVLARRRIVEFYERFDGNVYVAFSGGKDSTLLLHLVREIYPEVPAVFVDTGLEYPELRKFALTTSNLVVLKPKKTFRQVIEDHGWPLISKRVANAIDVVKNPTPKNAASRKCYLTGETRTRPNSPFKIPAKWRFLIEAPVKVSAKCCYFTKKHPLDAYMKQTGRKSYTGMMASDGEQRLFVYLKNGCNAFDGKKPTSAPLGVWLEQDVLTYLKRERIPIAPVYGEIVENGLLGGLVCSGVRRTGCVFCVFGITHDPRPNRFEQLALSHPKLHEYVMENLGLGPVLDLLGFPRGERR